MMNTLVTQPPEPRNSVASFVGRLFAAAALTAAAGALGNVIYERFFDPEAYAAGPVATRAAFAFAFPFPFILVGLFLIGAPVAYALRRFRLDNAIVFALAGAFSGASIGVVTASEIPRLQIVFVGYGSVSAVVYWALRRRV